MDTQNDGWNVNTQGTQSAKGPNSRQAWHGNVSYEDVRLQFTDAFNQSEPITDPSDDVIFGLQPSLDGIQHFWKIVGTRRPAALDEEGLCAPLELVTAPPWRDTARAGRRVPE
jgi:hypothetical protein